MEDLKFFVDFLNLGRYLLESSATLVIQCHRFWDNWESPLMSKLTDSYQCQHVREWIYVEFESSSRHFPN